MWKKTEKKLDELEKLVAVVGMMLEEELSLDTSDKDFMSTDLTPKRFLSQVE